MVKFSEIGTESPSSIDVILTSGRSSWNGVVEPEGACAYENVIRPDSSKTRLTVINNIDNSNVCLYSLVTSNLVNIHYNWHRVGNYLVLIKKG
jgi:hypothetical protein